MMSNCRAETKIWSHENAHGQLARYMDRLGVTEGWLVVFDSDYEKPWEEKIGSDDLEHDGMKINVVKC